MKNLRKIVRLLTAALLIVSLAGCVSMTATENSDTDTVSHSPTPSKLSDENSFLANIIEMDFDTSTAIVEPLEGESIRASADRISVNLTNLDYPYPVEGDTVRIEYSGDIRETYPAQIDVTNWELNNDLREYEYTETWLDKDKATKNDEDDYMNELIVKKIYKNCFFATCAYPNKYIIKVNGVLPDDFCVNDEIDAEQANVYTDEKTGRVESDLIRIYPPVPRNNDPDVCYKPVIYLYPEKETDINVKLDLNGELTCTYPKYDGGWSVKAKPDGTLTDKDGMKFNYLYWEGEINTDFDFSRGFCVKGSDTAVFLEGALKKLGLNRREANEFIVYWLPQMQNNNYNLISFQSTAYTDNAKLDITPKPDTMIRVFMAYKALEKPVDIQPQELEGVQRNGFAVVEWGGTEKR